MQKRTEITIETERFLIVRQLRNRTMLWCSDCGKTVPMLTVFEAAGTTGATPLEISDQLEAGKLHFVVTLEGRLLICSNSLT